MKTDNPPNDEDYPETQSEGEADYEDWKARTEED